LQAFQNQVRAQLEPLDSELAQTLIQRAQEIIDNLTSGSTGSPRALFTHCQRQGSGTFRLQFSTSSGKSPVIAASTNMTDWELIGVAVDRGDGTFEFEDAAAIRFGSRFYRFILP